MKKIIALFIAFAGAVAAFAQTPDEIVARMSEEMDKHEHDGLAMTVDIRLPILGTMSTETYSLGKKIRLTADMAGVKVVTWSDGQTKWTYSSDKNEIEIENEDANHPTESQGDTQMLSNITDGYDVSIKKDTPEAWYIQCRKSRSNKNKDDPKTMDLVVYKESYLPASLSASMSGVKVTMRDFVFGVTEQQVTFNPADYPGATIVDKR